MEHDLNRLREKMDAIDPSSIVGILSQLQQQLWNATHKPGFTSVAEFALIEVGLEAIHQQIETTIHHYRQLVEAAEKVGEH
jgi:hypothetical protein